MTDVACPGSKADLVRLMAEGLKPEWLFFWSHRPSPDGRIVKTCLSQWFPNPFEIDGVRYPDMEHFMMAEKARMFGDAASEAAILQAPDPREAKNLGRLVKGFDYDRWDRARFDIVVRGNMAKFSQDERLRSFLLGTHPKVLVEASPYDLLWGIGLAETDARARIPREWPGDNLLGFALMEVRGRLTSAALCSNIRA